MKKLFKQKREPKKKSSSQTRKSSLHSLSEYFCSYLAALDTVKSSN